MSQTTNHVDWVRGILIDYYLTPGTPPTRAELAERYSVHEKTVAGILLGRHSDGRPHLRAQATLADLGLELRGGRVVPVSRAQDDGGSP